jgi:hypothetical protein
VKKEDFLKKWQEKGWTCEVNVWNYEKSIEAHIYKGNVDRGGIARWPIYQMVISLEHNSKLKREQALEKINMFFEEEVKIYEGWRFKKFVSEEPPGSLAVD